ncbi:MAG: hypothetical protein JWN74_3567 [Acidobacteriaceae bacterium]|nr:hypothetical protein [Acidobacteriaceae bacterium]
MRSCNLAGGVPGEAAWSRISARTSCEIGFRAELTSANVAKSGFGFAAFCNTATSTPARQQLGVIGELGGTVCRCIGHPVARPCIEGEDNNEADEMLQTSRISKRVPATLAFTSIVDLKSDAYPAHLVTQRANWWRTNSSTAASSGYSMVLCSAPCFGFSTEAAPASARASLP